MRDENSVGRAKKNRRVPTQAEAKLWSLLRGRRLSMAKFRRQHAIGPYVVDFACMSAQLVVEVDGPSHDNPGQASFDAKRTVFLERNGWQVLRIPNDHVFQALDTVEALIFEHVISPPRGGEGTNL